MEIGFDYCLVVRVGVRDVWYRSEQLICLNFGLIFGLERWARHKLQPKFPVLLGGILVEILEF